MATAGGLTLHRVIAGSSTAGQSPAVVTVYDSPEATGQVVAELQFGSAADGYLGAGVYEIGTNLVNGLTVTQAQGGLPVTIVYE